MIKPDLKADLLVQNRNLLDDTSHIRNIESVIIGGLLVNRKSLDKLAADLVQAIVDFK